MHDDRDRLDRSLLATGDYATLLATYLPIVRDRVRARVRGPASDDVVQEVMLRLYRELHAGKTYPVTFRVVVHNVAGWLIRAHFEGRPPAELPLPDGDEGTAVWDEDPTDGPYLEWLLERLPDGERAAFELRAIQGLSSRQAADLLGTNPNAVDQAYFRARQRLQRILSGDG